MLYRLECGKADLVQLGDQMTNTHKANLAASLRASYTARRIAHLATPDYGTPDLPTVRLFCETCRVPHDCPAWRLTAYRGRPLVVLFEFPHQECRSALDRAERAAPPDARSAYERRDSRYWTIPSAALAARPRLVQSPVTAGVAAVRQVAT